MFKNHPKGLLAAALSNMGERFGYYIMNAVLLLFLCSKFGLSDETSGVIYAVFYALIYVLSLIGGYIADKTQNYKATIMSGLVTMARHSREHKLAAALHLRRPAADCIR